MYGNGNDIGVSPLMREMLRGYMRSCGHSEGIIDDLYQHATNRLTFMRNLLLQNHDDDEEAQRLRFLFFDILRELRVLPSTQLPPIEEKSLDVLCRTSRAMHGKGNDVGVSPLMRKMLRGHMRSCNHWDPRIPELYQLANNRLANQREELLRRGQKIACNFYKGDQSVEDVRL